MKKINNHLFFAWAEEELSAGRSVSFLVVGTSMSPLLRNGKETVTVSPCTPESLSPMDVVLFRYKGGHLLHRIIRRRGNHLWLQGDGSFVAVEQCSVSDVVGRVSKVCSPSGRELSTDSHRWKVLSRLWRCSDLLRRLMLRVYFRLNRG